MSDETNPAPRRYRSSAAVRSVSLALVAAVAFGAGLILGETSAPAAVLSRVPILGDGLDSTPDPSVDLADFWKAWNALNANYVITNASTTLPTAKERLYGAIQGLADSYGDPYTVFLPPEEAKVFAESISGTFAGVGMEIGVKNGILTVIAPLRGTPADRAGIKAGDLIQSIDDKTTEGLSTEEAVSKIRGPAGTTVKLSLVRDGAPLEISVVREQIQLPETKDQLDEKSGVYSIALFGFTSTSGQLFSEAFRRFLESGANKLVVDLRSNPGGYLESSVDIASHFLPKGAPVVIEDFGDKEKSRPHPSLGYGDLPKGTKVVVLIDGGSASASEIFAGALRDHGVATIIGTKSFGKGSVQTLMDLGKGSLKITVARWVTPSGHWIMENGITPDITVEFTAEDAAAGRDPQMERAVRFLTTGR